MREKQTEQHLVKAVKAIGGICPKLVSPGTDGMPDRMVLLPGGHIGFVEVKAPGQKPGRCRPDGMNSCGHWGSTYMCWTVRNRFPT